MNSYAENSFARFAVLSACHPAEWLEDPGVALPEDDYWVRSDAMPAPETERRLKLIFNKNSHPSIGDLLWVLFMLKTAGRTIPRRFQTPRSCTAA
jgi:hypothetical protein